MIERTLVFIKPDGVERNLIGEIIRRYENAGLRVVELRMIKPTMERLRLHYPENKEYFISIAKKAEKTGKKIDNRVEYGKEVVNKLRNYVASGKIVLMILEGEDAIKKVREVTGYTDPAKAEKGTIRGDLGNDDLEKATLEGRVCRNLVHASGSLEEAEKEIKLWFGEKYLLSEK